MFNKYIYRMTYHQTDKVADIFGDLGIVSIASVVLPAILNKTSLTSAIIGSVAFVFFFVTSLCLSK